ncbi:MAG: dihydroorotate dehydrogenase electron transfer subunit [Eubacteriales bacterium]
MELSYSSIIQNKNIIEDIYEIQLEFENKEVNPGQFFMVKSLEGSYLLPRPISVYDYDGKILKLLYKVVGKGTKIFSKLKIEEKVQILGPLGNGFPLEDIKGKVALIGGGIGTAPLNYLVKNLKGLYVDTYLGFKEEIYSLESFEKFSENLLVATESGSYGEKGFVTDFVNWENYDTIITCGPEIMMNKIIKTGNEKSIKIYASLERRMACGIGACLGCSVKTKEGIKRACKEGPVFSGEELVIEEQPW